MERASRQRGPGEEKKKKKHRVERGRRGEKIKIVQLLGKHVFSLFLNK